MRTRLATRRSSRSRPALVSPKRLLQTSSARRARARESAKSHEQNYQRLGLPGTRNLVYELLHALSAIVDPAISIESFLQNESNARFQMYAELNLVHRKICYDSHLPVRLDVLRRLNALMNTVQGRRRLYARMNTLRSSTMKQLLRLELLASVYGNGWHRMEIELFLRMCSTLRAAGIVQPEATSRIDCPICHGVHVPDVRCGAAARWVRHEECENWVCGACTDRLRADAAPYTATCPSCRAPLIGVQESFWPGRIEL